MRFIPPSFSPIREAWRKPIAAINGHEVAGGYGRECLHCFALVACKLPFKYMNVSASQSLVEARRPIASVAFSTRIPHPRCFAFAPPFRGGMRSLHSRSSNAALHSSTSVFKCALSRSQFERNLTYDWARSVSYSSLLNSEGLAHWVALSIPSMIGFLS